MCLKRDVTVLWNKPCKNKLASCLPLNKMSHPVYMETLPQVVSFSQVFPHGCCLLNERILGEAVMYT